MRESIFLLLNMGLVFHISYFVLRVVRESFPAYIFVPFGRILIYKHKFCHYTATYAHKLCEKLFHSGMCILGIIKDVSTCPTLVQNNHSVAKIKCAQWVRILSLWLK